MLCPNLGLQVLDRRRGGVYYWNKATHETTPLHAAPPQGFTPGAASLDPTRAPGQKGHPMYQAIGLAPPRPRPGALGQSEGSAAPQLGDGDRPAPLEGAEGAAAGDHARPRPEKERGGGVLSFFSGLSKRRDQVQRLRHHPPPRLQFPPLASANRCRSRGP